MYRLQASVRPFPGGCGHGRCGGASICPTYRRSCYVFGHQSIPRKESAAADYRDIRQELLTAHYVDAFVVEALNREKYVRHEVWRGHQYALFRVLIVYAVDGCICFDLF